jgi:hypothetical protein
MSRKTITRFSLAAVMLLSVLLLPAAALAHGGGGAAMYDVKVENLTYQQIFSPPVFVSHDSSYRLYRVRHFASTELMLIAENGDNSKAAERAMYSRRVFDVKTAPGPIFPGDSVTATLRSPRRARLSLAGMLVVTNDGFFGVDSVRLRGMNTQVYLLKSLDAGTEADNEMAAYVPGLGGMLRDPTHQRIHAHPGIKGTANIDSSYGWTGPVARLTITPVTP